MTSTDLSLVIDPGGIAGVRDGINLQVFPCGDEPLQWRTKGVAPRRTANSRLVASSWPSFLEFETEFALDATQLARLQALVDFNVNSASQLSTFEVVVYNLVEPFSELAPARTRFKVPGTNVITTESFGSLTRYTYWVAIQGNIQITYRQQGTLFLVSLDFTEGTRLTASMEP